MNKLWLIIKNKKFQKIIIRLFLWGIGIQSAMIIPVGVRNYLVPSKQYAAIVVSDYTMTKYDYWVSPSVIFFAYPFITTYFNNQGLKAYWYLRGRSAHLEKVIKDPLCQSILIVGHGTYHSWQAVDRAVNFKDIKAFMQDLPKKRGEWIQLTCGKDEGYPCKMGELVMSSEKVYTYDREVNSWPFIIDILSGFKYIRSLNCDYNKIKN